MDKRYTVLSDFGIMEELKNKNIVIEPFKKEFLSTSSYDVTLGNYYYKESFKEKKDSKFYFPTIQSEVERV